MLDHTHIQIYLPVRQTDSLHGDVLHYRKKLGLLSSGIAADVSVHLTVSRLISGFASDSSCLHHTSSVLFSACPVQRLLVWTNRSVNLLIIGVKYKSQVIFFTLQANVSLLPCLQLL